MRRADRIQAGLHFRFHLQTESPWRHIESGLDAGGNSLDGRGRVLIALVEDPTFALRDGGPAELFFRELVAPIAERALRKFHDVALVDQGHGLEPLVERKTQAAAYQLIRARHRDGFDAYPRIRAHPLFGAVHAQHCVHEINQPFCLSRAFPPLNARVDVFRILAEDDDVHAFRVAHGRRDAGNVFHGAPAGVEVQKLAQRDVEAADAAAYRRRQRAFDGDAKLLDRVERPLRKPFTKPLESLFPRKNFVPDDPALTAKYFFDGGVENPPGSFPDVPPRSVTLDVRNNGPVGDNKLLALIIDRRALGGCGNSVEFKPHVVVIPRKVEKLYLLCCPA